MAINNILISDALPWTGFSLMVVQVQMKPHCFRVVGFGSGILGLLSAQIENFFLFLMGCLFSQANRWISDSKSPLTVNEYAIGPM